MHHAVNPRVTSGGIVEETTGESAYRLFKMALSQPGF